MKTEHNRTKSMKTHQILKKHTHRQARNQTYTLAREQAHAHADSANVTYTLSRLYLLVSPADVVFARV